MLKGTRANWTVKRLCKEMKRGTVTFDNAVQRTLVWKKEQKSLLIDSILRGYPIPQMYANKNTETKVLDMLDGKQRSNAICDFISDMFELTDDVQPIMSEDEKEEIIVAGYKFSELPEEFQDIIMESTIDIIVYDDLNDDEVCEMFRRLNNGKPLSAIELTRVKAKSLEVIQDIGKHEIFEHALTAKALAKYGQEDMVMKAWCTVFEKSPSFETKVIRPLMEKVEITEEQADKLKNCFTKIFEAYKKVKEQQFDDQDEIKKRDKICKRMLTRTHLLSIVSIAKKEDVTSENIAEFCKHFFSGSKTTTNENYNNNASSSSASGERVQARIREINKSYNSFMNCAETKKYKITNEQLDNVLNEI